MHNRKRILIPILAILVLGAASAWMVYQRQSLGGSGALKASGSVEAVEVAAAPELSGRVAEVLVEAGDTVQAGDLLVRMDGELLQAQRKRAETALQAARDGQAAGQAGVDAGQAALNAADASAKAADASATAELLPLQTSLDDLNNNASLVKAQAEQAVAAANRSIRETTYQLDNYTVPTGQQQMTAMEAVQAMKEKLDRARENFEPYKYRSSGDATREDYKDTLEEAQSDYDSAVKRLEYETSVARAQAALDQAMRDLDKLKDGPDPDQVAALEARIQAVEAGRKQAQAGVEQAQAGLTQAQKRLEQAQTAVDQAQAELDLIDAQIARLEVRAAVTGVVMTRNIEPGEVVQPGASLLTIGELDRLTITVFVPEDRYGQIQLNQAASVQVDSFPGETFQATVERIADQAEFTPRNVQTEEGRSTTVFAVKLAIDNPEGKLKPGMPADVYFER